MSGYYFVVVLCYNEVNRLIIFLMFNYQYSMINELLMLIMINVHDVLNILALNIDWSLVIAS